MPSFTDLKIDIEIAVKDMNDIDQTIIVLKMKGHTQQYIGLEVGLSQQAISYRLKSIRARLYVIR